VPPSCHEFPEIHRLLLSMGLRQAMTEAVPTSPLSGKRAPAAPLAPTQSQPMGNRPPATEIPARNTLAPATPLPDIQQPPSPPGQGQRATPPRVSVPGRASHLLPDPWDAKPS
jgi:hypothetical protein